VFFVVIFTCDDRVFSREHKIVQIQERSNTRLPR